MNNYIFDFSEVDLSKISEVGGKNASLGEMYQKLTGKGIRVPEGFATTAGAFREFLSMNNLTQKLEKTLSRLDTENFSNLKEIGSECRAMILNVSLQLPLQEAIRKAYIDICSKYSKTVSVAVRSSATAEDLPSASFAGQHESYLNITGEENVLNACLRCFASLFTDRAIKYRHDNGFEHMEVALSVGVQKMVRADLASSGVCFTLDPESGFSDVILITGAWGLGENVVQGAVNPDEFYVFKPSIKKNKKAIIGKKVGSKTRTMIFDTRPGSHNTVVNIETPAEKADKFVLSDEEIDQVAKWSLTIEEHYQKPMDIEWAKDGETGQIFILQARPETVRSRSDQKAKILQYTLLEKGKVLASGKRIGNKIASGVARVIKSPKDAHLLKEGEILVTEITNPDWDPILKKAAAVITDKGGRTSHAAIVAREIGAAAIVGAGNASSVIKNGTPITVSCIEGDLGMVYEGLLKWKKEEIDVANLHLPETKPMFILGDPDQAFYLRKLPNQGVGLMRLEFVINNSIKVHPMALVRFNELNDLEAKEEISKLIAQYPGPESYFVENLSRAVGTIAASFYPKDVIVRMSDFKSNEYANLLGGKEFEPKEENPMLGLRGASRYYNEVYKAGFGLECKAMKVVREQMGLENVKLMIPFCRTVEEGKKVLEVMEEFGLKRGENGLEVYVMAEIPSNVILSKEFAEIFDGFSIGSNDLTQLTLGIDRDSSTVSDLFNENDKAALEMISRMIRDAKTYGRKIGLCGQAPSDFPEYAQFLVKQGIDSISFNPDALIKGIENINKAELQEAASPG